MGLLFAGKFGTAASTGVVMPPKPQMIAKQDWRYVSGGGRVMRNAHEPSTEITSLAFANNGHSLTSRWGNETLKVRLTVCLSVCLSVFLTHHTTVSWCVSESAGVMSDCDKSCPQELHVVRSCCNIKDKSAAPPQSY